MKSSVTQPKTPRLMAQAQSPNHRTSHGLPGPLPWMAANEMHMASCYRPQILDMAWAVKQHP